MRIRASYHEGDIGYFRSNLISKLVHSHESRIYAKAFFSLEETPAWKVWQPLRRIIFILPRTGNPPFLTPFPGERGCPRIRHCGDVGRVIYRTENPMNNCYARRCVASADLSRSTCCTEMHIFEYSEEISTYVLVRAITWLHVHRNRFAENELWYRVVILRVSKNLPINILIETLSFNSVRKIYIATKKIRCDRKNSMIRCNPTYLNARASTSALLRLCIYK
jgi:hypothetical protein